jgi:hypothetical protein
MADLGIVFRIAKFGPRRLEIVFLNGNACSLEIKDDQQKTVDMSRSGEQADRMGMLLSGDQATLNHINKAHQTKTS